MGGWFGEVSLDVLAETYGRHTLYRLHAVPVVVLLQEAVDEGRPVRLKWRDPDTQISREIGEMWPA